MSVSFRGIEDLCQALEMRPQQMEIPLERHQGEECLQGEEGHLEEELLEEVWDEELPQGSWPKCPNSPHHLFQSSP